jgi:hypothetical protein
MNENITSSSPFHDIPTMFQILVSTSGISPIIFFCLSLTLFLIPIISLKLPKELFLFSNITLSFFYVQIGILPIWFFIFNSILSGFLLSAKAFGVYKGDYESYVYHNEDWKSSIPVIEDKLDFSEPKTINCKNCGGPNIDKIKCEWCGLILE